MLMKLQRREQVASLLFGQHQVPAERSPFAGKRI